MANRVYNESQSYKGTWVIYLLLMIEIPSFIFAAVLAFNSGKSNAESMMGIGIMLLIMVGVFVGLLSFRLKLRIDDKGVHYNFPPLINKLRTIPKSNIQEIKVIKYNPISDFGGWGLKGNSTTKAYSIIGNMGLLIDLGEKKKIMIGIQKDKELKAFLENWKEDK